MSLFGSLFSSVSALSAQSKSMSMISDNVANVNTTAYKGAVADFSSLVTRRPSSQSYSPGGVRAFTSYNVEQQGLIQSSASPTDVAISGSGFFVVDSAPGADGVEGEQLYTRAGSFEPDYLGNLRTPSGFYLQGWVLDATESIVDVNVLETVNIRQIQGVAAATTELAIGANLNADAGDDDSSWITNGVDYDATLAVVGSNNMAQFLSSGGITGTPPHFQRDIQIYDSLGRPRTVTVAFVREDPTVNPNTWYVEVVGDTNDLDAAHVNGLIAHGQVEFDADGNVTTVGAALDNITINWDAKFGANASAIDIDWGVGTSTGLTQFSSASDVAYVTQNGAEVGELNGVRINEEGFVIATFTNGEERKLYKLPIATFANPSALDPRSGNVYSQTDIAGEYNLRFAGVGGAGSITTSSLESANVDIAEEFTKMIVTQRAYSASSKIISTADQLLEELLRIAG